MSKVSVLNGKLCVFILCNSLTDQRLMACRKEDTSETSGSIRVGSIRVSSLSKEYTVDSDSYKVTRLNLPSQDIPLHRKFNLFTALIFQVVASYCSTIIQKIIF
jgi:hypothetical protein